MTDDLVQADGRSGLLFGGFAPLIFLAALLLVAAILVPSIAPEQYVPKPAARTTTTVSDAP